MHAKDPKSKDFIVIQQSGSSNLISYEKYLMYNAVLNFSLNVRKSYSLNFKINYYIFIYKLKN